MTAPDLAPTVELRGARVAAARGTVFGPLSALSHSPITVVCGANGSGRTSLLLSIAGRMRLSEGEIITMGEAKRAAARARTGIVGFSEIDALEPSVTVGATLRERLAWAMPWYRRTPRIGADLAGELLHTAFGDIAQPAPDTLVRELTSVEHMLLRIALALIDGPEMLVIDDFDALRDPADRALVAARLNALAAGALRASAPIAVVLATCDPRDVTLFSAHNPATIAL